MQTDSFQKYVFKRLRYLLVCIKLSYWNKYLPNVAQKKRTCLQESTCANKLVCLIKVLIILMCTFSSMKVTL